MQLLQIIAEGKVQGESKETASRVMKELGVGTTTALDDTEPWDVSGAAARLLGHDIKAQLGIKGAESFQALRNALLPIVAQQGERYPEALDWALSLAYPRKADITRLRVEAGWLIAKKYGGEKKFGEPPPINLLAGKYRRMFEALDPKLAKTYTITMPDPIYHQLTKFTFSRYSKYPVEWATVRDDPLKGLRYMQYYWDKLKKGVTGHASGGIAFHRHVAEIAERGPEAIIPLDKINKIIPQAGPGMTVNVYSSPSVTVNAASSDSATAVDRVLATHREQLVREVMRGIDRRMRDLSLSS